MEMQAVLAKKQLKTLTAAGKALQNRRVRHILQCLWRIGNAPRKKLKNCVRVNESTFSEYLSLMAAGELVKLNRVGRQVIVEITPSGRYMLSSTNDLEAVARIMSDENRFRIIELLNGNGELTFTQIYHDLNDLSAEKKHLRFSTALLCYHLRILRKEGNVSVDNSVYHVTPKGRKFLHIASSFLS